MRMLLPIAMAGAAVWLFFGFTMPHYDLVQQMQVVAASYQDTLDQANQLNQLKNKLLANFKGFSPQSLARLDQLLPTSLDTTHFIVTVSNLAAADGVSVASIQVSPSGQTEASAKPVTQSAPAGNFIPASVGSPGTVTTPVALAGSKTITVNVKIGGTYPAINAFLRDIEQSLQLMDITSLTVGSGVGSSNQMSADISFKTYIYSAR